MTVFSPDGRTLASASEDKSIGLWDWAAGKELRLLGHQGGVLGVAFSPDGRTLASGSRDKTIRLWELASGKVRHMYEANRGHVSRLAFSADGKLLAWGSLDTDATARVATVTALGPAPDRQPTSKELEALWADLASDDAARAYQAICTLSAYPQESVALLKIQLRPAQAVLDPKRVADLIAALDHDEFAVREKATAELAKLGPAAAMVLRQALDRAPSAEVQRRLEDVLARLDGGKPLLSAEELRAVRSVEVLERIGTSQAQQTLEVLSKGAPEAPLTQEAKLSLARLAKRGN